jgi:hypothetical protein
VILHPAVIANIIAALTVSLMVVYSTYHGLRIYRHWNIESGSELQLTLERRTYLVSTLLAYTFGLQLISLFLYVFTADTLYPLFVGAMCAAGALSVNAFGYPTLILKVGNFLMAGLWLVMNHADNQAYDYPLIRKKYLLLAVIAPFIVAETIVELAYFLKLDANVITSCCGALFSSERVEGLGSEIAALPAKPTIWAFYISIAAAIGSGTYFYFREKGGYLYSGLSVLAFFVSIVAIISCISLYIYELPTHHCPFCIIMEEYDYIGYLLYVLLFGAVVAGASIAVLMPFRAIESLRAVMPPLLKKLALTSIVFYAAFAGIVTYRIAISNLRL